MKTMHCILLLAIALIITVFVSQKRQRDQLTKTTSNTQSAQGDTVKKSPSPRPKDLSKRTPMEELQLKVPTLFEHPTVTPEFAVLQKLTKADEAALIAYYQAQTNLFHRISAIWALAYIGDEKTFELFKHTLTSEFAGQTITSKSAEEDTDEENVMLRIVSAMGLLAQHNASAFYFLKQGTDPWFWYEKVLWTSKRGKDTYGLLTSAAIMAAAESGHDEFPVILENLKNGPLINPIGGIAPNDRNIAGAIVDSAFNYQLAKKLSYDDLFQIELNPYLREKSWQEWKISAEGIDWRNWYNKIHGFPPVSRNQNEPKIVN